MKRGHKLVMGVLGVVALAVVLALLAAGGEDVRADGAIIYVDADATGEALDGTSWQEAFLDLQDALDVAGTGDQIWVAEGTYKPTVEHGGEEYGMSGPRLRSFQLENGVAIYGGFDPTVGHDTWVERDWQNHVTVLSGDLDGDDGPDFANNDENSFHVFYHAEGAVLDGSAILDGFTIRGGNANLEEIDEHYRGGGMTNEYGASPALANLTFADNWAGSSGGGIFNGSASAPTLTDCILTGNSAFRGGGMRNEGSSPTMVNCTFTMNQAEYGGGVSNDNASPALTDCTFTLNEATSGGGMANSNSSPALIGSVFLVNLSTYGGGMFNGAGSSPELVDCAFQGNRAQSQGGGMVNESSSPTLTNCTFTGNQAWYGDGGGIYNQESTPTLAGCALEANRAEYDGGGVYNENSSPTLTNCTFAGNVASGDYGGGMVNAASSSPTLTNCVFWGNSADGGGGIYSDHSLPALTNCIVWGNSPDQISFESSTVVVNYSDVHGGYPGENNLASDPLFVDPGNGDFHLQPGSPCIDTGSNSAPSLPPYDFEGDERVVDGDLDGAARVDMGVDEALPQSIFLPMVLRGH